MTFRDTTEIEKILAEYHSRDEAGGEGHDSTEDLIRKAYTAGLRRAQEMAEDYGGIDFDDIGFDRAIDAEAAKERT